MSRTEKQPTNERLRDPNGCPGSRSLTTREGASLHFSLKELKDSHNGVWGAVPRRLFNDKVLRIVDLFHFLHTDVEFDSS